MEKDQFKIRIVERLVEMKSAVSAATNTNGEGGASDSSISAMDSTPVLAGAADSAGLSACFTPPPPPLDFPPSGLSGFDSSMQQGFDSSSMQQPLPPSLEGFNGGLGENSLNGGLGGNSLNSYGASVKLEDDMQLGVGSVQEDEVLDDNAFAKLSGQESEHKAENLVNNVVQQWLELLSSEMNADDLREEINALDCGGLSMLHYVCLYNYAELVPTLLEHGADVNCLSQFAVTPLHMAAEAGHQEVR
jgi:hypothetical protein